jgi:drug/metabolite transporter (DMT)-like permease
MAERHWVSGMGETWGVLAAALSSAFGGTAIGATRYLVNAIDPLAIGSVRFGVGFILLLPLAWWKGDRWPARRDWPAAIGLGVLYFALFPILFNASVIFTTAARASLALSTLPLLTMLVGAALGHEPLTPRKTLGVLIAMCGVALALLSGLASAPVGAWRGDLLMVAAALCMALYSIWSRPFVARSGPITFTALSMGVGALCLILISLWRGSFVPVADFGLPQWVAVLYLGAFGGAVIFYLWAFALERTTPTRVAISVTVNPITASLIGAVLLGEPLNWNLAGGIVTVFAGIWIATSAGGCGLSRDFDSSRWRAILILWQAVVDPDPVHLFGDPDVLRRRKGMAIVEHRQRHARRGAVGAPGEQPRAASLAEHPVQMLGGGVSAGVALDCQSRLREQRAREKGRAHCLLAESAMAEADVDRLSLRLETNRAAQASAFSGHDVLRNRLTPSISRPSAGNVEHRAG